MIQTPQWLDDKAQKLWKKLSAELDSRGDLTPATAETLAMLVKAYWDYRTATALVDSEGQVITTKTTKKAHPALQVQKQAFEQYTRLANDLGLTPKSKGKSLPNASGDVVSDLRELMGADV